MISDNEKKAVVQMFCAFCKKTLINARTDLMREMAKNQRREKLFSEMSEAELNRLRVPDEQAFPAAEVVFEVRGLPIGVVDEELADALAVLPDDDRAIVLLFYFAGWTDKRIASLLGRPRSTVQYRRFKSLRQLRVLLEGKEVGDGDADI
ncbi:hypothetical protein BHK98_09250 [Hornefia porci]|uniref:RNA polymerase sigma factor 70 region 4 type 2 domain-containing protein n=1 Tax=Hornefia porci TaxID=2652292 RepID=A0A1Q9JJ99_9FIRM|nr:sigma-70 family RNA polymerase sigma factor [Hornefia porci]OLR56234.1 hypothetical protein BHK98_09250 [Hornefia porci]